MSFGKECAVRGALPLVLALTAACPSESAPAAGVEASLPRLEVVRAEHAPTLDGLLAEPAWRSARSTAAFVETRQGGPAAFAASARFLWDAGYLYLGVEVDDGLLRASQRERDAHLWEQDCVELMIDPDGDGKNYFEIQASPGGALFDTRYDSRRVPRPFGHLDWDSQTRVSVSTRGILDDAEADDGYTVELAIPWQAFSPGNEAASAPAIGEEWRANVYVMDLGRDRQRAAAWSPLGIGDFHVPARFGILRFVGAPEDMQTLESPLGPH